MGNPGAPRDPSTTYRLADLQEAAIEALRRRAARRLSLLVYHPAGIEAAVLEPGSPIVVGRHSPEGLSIPDASLSRTHARFTLQDDDRVLVEDLGSTNGVWVGEVRVPRAEIKPGDDVVLGKVLACVRSLGAADPGERPVQRVSTAADRAPIAVAPAMREALALADRVAGSAVPVIVHGETGSGKEVVARWLHERGPRRERPLVSVNCAAIPAQLVESTLFGHEKGAFTGAGQRQKGVFEEADGGTVFLDEIGELPAAAQAALLRVLETRRFARVGSVKEISADVRVVAATHRDLEAMCEKGTFRADLYYRLNTVVLTVPPLRARTEDIEPLAQRFLKDASGGRPLRFSAEALAAIMAHAWPGNVRELRNAVERAAVITQGDTIDLADLPATLRGAAATTTLPPPAPLPRLSDPPTTLPPEAPASGDLRALVQAYETRILVETLESTGWNQSEAARRLGMPIRTLSNKVKALGLKRPDK
ncbi:MAG: sigma 54-interacting transcriptional regulator [Minicystis sp.]